MPVDLSGFGSDAHGNLSRPSAGGRLVVFGAGYVGGELARQALARGWKVTALTRNPDVARALRESGVETVVHDIADAGWHGLVPGGADFAVNCVSSGGGGPDGYRRSYLGGMQSVAAWSRLGRVGTLLYTSSTSVYPQGAVGAEDGPASVVDETAAIGGMDESATVLVETEALLRTAEAGRRFILRLAGIYGPGRHHLLDQVRAGVTKFAGRGDFRLNLIHRDDAVGAILAALGAPSTLKDEVFNVSDGNPATKAEVVAWLAERLGKPTPRFTGESAGTRRRASRDRIISNEKLRRLLDWRPRYPDFRAGYRGMLD